MMTSQILKFVDFTKTQKSRYHENETLFFLQIKKFINSTSRATLLQNKFCSGGNFNDSRLNSFLYLFTYYSKIEKVNHFFEMTTRIQVIFLEKYFLKQLSRINGSDVLLYFRFIIFVVNSLNANVESYIN